MNYNEPMTGTPTITFGGIVGVFSSNADGTWATATQWTETFTHDGTAEEVTGATADSSLATDVAGNPEGADVQDTFDVDTIAPGVAVYSPVDNAIDVAIDANLVLTFDDNVQAGVGNIVIYKVSNNSVFETIDITSGQVVFNGTTGVSINPTNNFINNRGYYVQIDNTAIEDDGGNAYAGIADSTTWSFQTIGTGDNSIGIVSGSSLFFVQKREIPGCGTRIDGFSTISGLSCYMNIPHDKQGVSNEQAPGTPGFQFTLLLKLGSTGDEVMELQKFLNNAPYNSGLVADGKFGPKTNAAVIKFQLANGLVGDGIVGPMTRVVLNK